MLVGAFSQEGRSNYDPYHLFMGGVPFTVDQARMAAQNEAYSYRGFRVGAAVFALNPATQETAVLSGANTKSNKHKTKICAERKVLQQAKKAGLTEAIGIVVAATTDVDLIEEVNGAPSPTLHPCQECQHFFNEHPLIMDDTIIITTGIDDDTHQVHTHKEVAAMYSGKRIDPATEVHGESFDNWNETRQALYDNLAFAEASLAPEKQRSRADLAVIAMRSFAV